MQQLKNLFTEYFGYSPSDITAIAGEGSNRRYYRMTLDDGRSVIGVIGTSEAENKAFITISSALRMAGQNAPEVLAMSVDYMRYIQQDLGNTSLFEALKKGRMEGGDYDSHEILLLERTIKALPHLQVEGNKHMDYSCCYPKSDFDTESIFFDLNYFKYNFLKLTGIEFDEMPLQRDFEALSKQLLEEKEWGFMYRDFQARNVMLDGDEKPWFIDFQGGRRGPLLYDLASFLWQASAKYDDKLREKLFTLYINELGTLREVDHHEEMRKRLDVFVLFRLLQVLGAYGFRGLWEHKSHFLNSIPPAVENVKNLMAKGVLDGYPYLKTVMHKVVLWSENREKNKKKGIRVYSFSYKKGIPTDDTGNGGGYVFDCRGSNNPGRYDEYKPITGLDRPVIDYLETDGEIVRLLENIYPMADFHVQRWLDRGFTDLMFSFGCTGGQHRSVYSAQHLAEHICKKFNVPVYLCHRERGWETTLVPENKAAGNASAMIFAAGLGTRLKPLTDTMPKALVPVNGKTLLQRTVETLKTAGINDIVVNVHHFSQQIIDYLKANNNFGTNIQVSDETDGLLETGGGLKKALPLFDSTKPILIHNVDIVSNVQLDGFLYVSQFNDATLLVSQRKTKRYLLFNKAMDLVGWTNIETGEVRTPYPDLKIEDCKMFAFAGIHAVSPRIAKQMSKWPDRFPIMDFYIQSCSLLRIKGIVSENLRLMDVGKMETLEEAEQLVAELDKEKSHN